MCSRAFGAVFDSLLCEQSFNPRALDGIARALQQLPVVSDILAFDEVFHRVSLRRGIYDEYQDRLST
jgi:hypothetical protein